MQILQDTHFHISLWQVSLHTVLLHYNISFVKFNSFNITIEGGMSN